MYIVKAIPNYPNQQYICVCIITTSIAHRIKNPPRRTSEHNLNTITWTSNFEKKNIGFSHIDFDVIFPLKSSEFTK